MENWQVVLIVLASVLVGALIPSLVMFTTVLYRAAREVTSIGTLIEPTLLKVQVISDRVEALSEGLEGGESSVAKLLSVIGELSRGLERNLKVINVASTVIAAAAPAVVAFIQARRAKDETGDHTNGS